MKSRLIRPYVRKNTNFLSMNGNQIISDIENIEENVDRLNDDPFNSNIVNSFSENDVAMIIVTGQSNAEGYLDGEIIPTETLNNIFVIKEGERTWSPYDSSNSNVFRSDRSNIYNPLNTIAREWQSKIDNGENLPDLYIANISYSGAGFSSNINRSQFNPLRKTNIGTLYPIPQVGEIDTEVSIYELVRQVLQAGVSDIISKELRPVYIGTIMSQWEADAKDIISVNNYINNIVSFRNMIDNTLGIDNAPFYYYTPISDNFEFKDEILESFKQFKKEHINIYEIDIKYYPKYNIQLENYGIFYDTVHYLKEVHEWVANRFLENFNLNVKKSISSSSNNLVEFVTASIDSSQTSDLSVGDHVKFAKILFKNNTLSNIDLDILSTYSTNPLENSIGRFTLKKGFYEISSSLKAEFIGSGDLSVILSDVTNSLNIQGIEIIINTDEPSKDSFTSIISVEEDTIFELQITSSTNVSSISNCQLVIKKL